MINFYHMEGCPHCVDARTALQPQIDSGKINLLPHQAAVSKGVTDFPYFELVDANKNVLKTSTGWSGKQNLYNNLGYIETYDNCNTQNYYDQHNVQNQENYNTLDHHNMNHDQQNVQNHQTFFPVVEHFRSHVSSKMKGKRFSQCCDNVAWKICGKKDCRTFGNTYSDCWNNPTKYQDPVPGRTHLKCPATPAAEEEYQYYNPYHDQTMLPVVEHMETVSTDVLYRHHTGGYSKLSNCWVKQPHYTA